MKYREIGEKFEHEGVMLEVVEGKPLEECYKCYFDSKGICGGLFCTELFRKDEKSVIFKEVKDERN